MSKFQVSIADISSDQRIELLKVLRLIGDLDLKNAKDLASFLESNKLCILVAGINQDVAEYIVSLLQEAGASALVEESTMSTPLFLAPTVNQRYRWNWAGGRVQLE